MSRTEFHFEIYNEVSGFENGLIDEAEDRLRALGENQTDMIGASLSIEELTGEETPHFFQARVVAYLRPENVTGLEKADTIEVAVRGAVDAVERQIQKRRAKLRQPYKLTEEGVDATVYQLNAREIYDTFAAQDDPADLIDQGRTSIAARLMVDEGLDEEAAYHAANQILLYADEEIEGEHAEAEEEEVLVYTGKPGVEVNKK